MTRAFSPPWFTTARPTRKHLAGFVFVFPAAEYTAAIGAIPTCETSRIHLKPAILGSPNVGFWNLQNLEPPNIPEKFDYHDFSNQNGQFLGGTLQKFDGIQLAKRCLKRCCTMYRGKMCQPTYHTFRPSEYDETYFHNNLCCYWLLLVAYLSKSCEPTMSFVQAKLWHLLHQSDDRQ